MQIHRKNTKAKNNLKKQNHGITLIALIVTIIVLLILAGVVIATLTGDNGIITKANEEEQVRLAVIEALNESARH